MAFPARKMGRELTLREIREMVAEMAATIAFSAIRNGDKVGLLAAATDDLVKKGVHAGNISRAIKELVDKGIIKMIKPRHEFYAATYELQTPKESEGGTNY